MCHKRRELTIGLHLMLRLRLLTAIRNLIDLPTTYYQQLHFVRTLKYGFSKVSPKEWCAAPRADRGQFVRIQCCTNINPLNLGRMWLFYNPLKYTHFPQQDTYGLPSDRHDAQNNWTTLATLTAMGIIMQGIMLYQVIIFNAGDILSESMIINLQIKYHVPWSYQWVLKPL